MLYKKIREILDDSMCEPCKQVGTEKVIVLIVEAQDSLGSTAQD